MSRETQAWLDEMILIGFTAPEHGRGEAWHRRQGNQNSFEHAVPFERAYELIAGWEPLRVTPMYHDVDKDEYLPLRYNDGKSPIGLIHSGNGALLGLHSESYPTHGYKERLFDCMSDVLDTSSEDIEIGSAGLLSGYRRAWVQLELPDTIEHPSGERYRPFITAATSLDGTLTTNYFKGCTRVVCDNTLSIGMFSATHSYKVKNAKNSQLKINDAREALEIVFKISDDFQTELDQLLAIKVDDRRFEKFIQMYIPLPEQKPAMAKSRRLAITDLYHTNPMVAPWKGTAWGVLQAVNTYAEHYQSISKGAQRWERSMSNFLDGKTHERDSEILGMLQVL